MTSWFWFGASFFFSPIEFRCNKQFSPKRRIFMCSILIGVLILYILIIIMNFSLVNLNFSTLHKS